MPYPLSERYPDETRSIGTGQPTDTLPEVNSGPQSRTTSPPLQYAEPKLKDNNSTQVMDRPRLPYPEVSTAELIDKLKELQRTSTASSLTMALAHARQINDGIARKRDEELENKTKENQQKAEMEKSNKAKNITSWITSVLGLIGAFIGAALIIGATGGIGIAGAIALVACALGGIMSAMTVVGLSLHEAGAKRTNVFGEKVDWDISFGGFAEMGEEEKVAKGEIKVIGTNATEGTAGAITRKQFNENVSDLKLGINIAVAVVTLVLAVISIGCAIRSITTGASKVAEVAESTSQVAQTARTAATVAAAGASALGAIGSGISAGYSIDLGYRRRDLSDIAIVEKTIAAVIEILQQQFDANAQNFRNSMNFLETLRTRIAEVMSEHYKILIDIGQNARV
jgi:hypothetical protein